MSWNKCAGMIISEGNEEVSTHSLLHRSLEPSDKDCDNVHRSLDHTIWKYKRTSLHSTDVIMHTLCRPYTSCLTVIQTDIWWEEKSTHRPPRGDLEQMLYNMALHHILSTMVFLHWLMWFLSTGLRGHGQGWGIAASVYEMSAVEPVWMIVIADFTGSFQFVIG